MNEQRQITPIIGLGKLALIGLAVLAIGWFVIQSRSSVGDHVVLDRQEMFPTGCVYGLLAIGCWWASAVGHRYARLAIRVLIVATAAVLLGLLREDRAEFQTAADLAGFAIVQSLVFYLFQVPSWHADWGAGPDKPTHNSEQFTIADIAISTTVIAVLLAIAIRYSPSIQPVRYWIVIALAWLGGALVTTCVGLGMTSRSFPRSIALVLLALAIAVAGTYAIAAADSIVDEGKLSYDTIRLFGSFYGRIVAGYVGTFTLLAATARLS